MTTRQSWDDRIAELTAFIETNGRPPSRLGTPEARSLQAWLTAQRRSLRSGSLSKSQAEAITKLCPAFPLRPFEASVAELEEFHANHGRLPRNSKTADVHEHRMATFLIQQVRTMFRKGLLGPEMMDRLGRVPGALEVRIVQDQESILQELTGYSKTHGHLPPLGGSGNADENRLASWMRNNTRGSALEKHGKLRDRHIAILAIIDRYPKRSEALEEGRMKELEAFVRKNGHRPSFARTCTPTEQKLAIWLRTHETSTDPRMVAAAKAPSRTDVEWQANFTLLSRYASSHDGRLPTGWPEGRIFSWLTIQRREYRRGKMSAARLEKLLTIDGVIPGKTLLAEAA